MYFYTGDFPSSAVFRVNVDTGLPLPTVYYSGAQVVNAMAYDQAHQRLLMLVVGKNNQNKEIGLIVAIPDNGPVSTLLVVPDGINLNWVEDMTVVGNILYVAFKMGDSQIPTYHVAALDVSKPTAALLKNAALNCAGYPNKVVPYYFAFDAKSSSLIGHAEVITGNNSVSYAVASIQANPKANNFGSCTVTLLNYDEQTIIPAAVYDPVGRNLYLNVLNSGGSTLVTFSVASNKIDTYVGLGAVQLMNVEYSPN